VIPVNHQILQLTNSEHNVNSNLCINHEIFSMYERILENNTEFFTIS
jgi:hypothetical protein